VSAGGDKVLSRRSSRKNVTLEDAGSYRRAAEIQEVLLCLLVFVQSCSSRVRPILRICSAECYAGPN
jgi:hypothetical protein